RQLLEKVQPVRLRQSVAVEGIDTLADGRLKVRGRHLDTGKKLAQTADLVIACTGYQQREPRFLAPVAERLHKDSRDRFVIENNHSVAADGALANRLFVANAEHHAVGVSAPNLDIGAVRNAKILNTVLGREVYRLQRNTAFTSFAAEGDDLDE